MMLQHFPFHNIALFVKLIWSAESSRRNYIQDTEFHCKVLRYLWNRNVLASLTAFKISTITSNAIKLAFSLLWEQFTWGHWSKARFYLCLCIAHSGGQGKNHTPLVMCWILQGMKITTHSTQMCRFPACSVLTYELYKHQCTPVSKGLQTGADLEVDPFFYARWGKQNYRTGNALKCPHAVLHSAKYKMKTYKYIYMRMAFSPL